MGATIRIATAQDRAGWMRLRAELWPECSQERHLLETEQLLVGDGLVAVAELGGELVGFAELSVRKDHVEGTRSAPVPYLEGWYVRPQNRGQRLGGKLLDFVEGWARDQGFGELASDVELENRDGLEVHTRFGFREVGRSVHLVKELGRELERVKGVDTPARAAGRRTCDSCGALIPLDSILCPECGWAQPRLA